MNYYEIPLSRHHYAYQHSQSPTVYIDENSWNILVAGREDIENAKAIGDKDVAVSSDRQQSETC